jgi:nucleoid DNA-binding protein
MAKANGAKSASKSLTKSQFFAEIAEKTGLKKAEVAKVFDAIAEIMRKQLRTSKNDPVKSLTLPGLLKVRAKYVPAQKGGKETINRFTGEKMITKDKPASVRVTARALKALKEKLM